MAQGVAARWASGLTQRGTRRAQAEIERCATRPGRERAACKGAAANGYVTDVWTLPRVAEVIEHITGVSYHPGHVWYVLRDQLDWTCQRPARRATERNDEAIERWVKKRWPQLKKRPGARTRC